VARNFYVVLGVPLRASSEHIRSAYRTLAKHYHPDRAGPGSETRFREISEAYEILSNPVSRRRYDDELRVDREVEAPTAEPLVDTPQRMRPAPLVADPIPIRRSFHTSHPSLEDALLDWTTRHFVGHHLPKSGRQQQIDVDVILSREEAELGIILPIRIPGFLECSACGRTGQDWFGPCLACNGSGVIEGRRTVRLRVPASVHDGTVWEIPILEAGVQLRVHIRVDPSGP
jgi:hypothetical protein